jgi:hypothetical protein
MGGASEILFGSSPKMKKLDTGTKNQQRYGESLIDQLMQQMQGGGYGQSQDWMQSLYGPDAFNQFAQPHMQQFEQQFEQNIMPMIAEKFAGFGNSGGALSSSGFGQSLSGAGAQGASDLQSKLAQMFAQLQMSASGQLSNNFNQQSQQALNYQPFQYMQQPGKSGIAAPMLGAIGGAFGGPMGAMAGNMIGGGMSSMFGG